MKSKFFVEDNLKNPFIVVNALLKFAAVRWIVSALSTDCVTIHSKHNQGNAAAFTNSGMSAYKSMVLMIVLYDKSNPEEWMIIKKDLPFNIKTSGEFYYVLVHCQVRRMNFIAR